MEGFKNTTRMKAFGDVAPQAYAKGGSVKPAAKVGKVMGEFAEGKLHSGSKTGPKVTNKKQAIAIGISEAKKAGAKGPMKKANGGEIVRMTDAERRASLEVPSRGMTPAEARALRATMAAKAAAPKREPLIGRGTISDRDEGRALRAMPKNSNPMSPAEVRRLIEMDRPTNKMGAEAYKGGGKVGASKVPFAVKKVMRKAEGGAVNQPSPMPELSAGYDVTPAPMKPPVDASDIIRAQQAFEMARLTGGVSPGPSPEMPQEPTPQSVFGLPKLATAAETAAGLYGTTHPTMPSGYGTSPGPMPTMPSADNGMVQLTPGYIDNNGNRVEATYGQQSPQPQFYDYVYTPKNSPEMFAADRARVAAAQAAQADRAATAQAQQEMAAQAQMDQGLGRGLAPMYGRGAPPRFMR